MPGSPDVIVVGAGIVGAACAYYAVQEGLRVMLVEASFAGSGATAASMGHIVVMDDSDAQLTLTSYSRRLWAELAEISGALWEDDRCGTLWVAADPRELARLEVKAELYRQHGVRATVLAPDELAAAEPQLRSGLAGALLVPDDRVIYPPGATRWLVEQAVLRGVQLREGCEVQSLDGCTVVCDGERIDAGQVVNAAGAQASRIISGLPIEPRRGHLVVTDRYPGFCRHQVVELGYLDSAHSPSSESVAFNIQPRRTDQLLIGSCREQVGWDRRINRRLVGEMLQRASRFMPKLSELLALRVWLGFRPATPDNLPLIGRWPQIDGVWIAAGHEGLGITLAPATGRLLADLLIGRAPTIDPGPYDPARWLEGA